jgi:nucleotide-binding universal stress UspA family protein
MRHRARLAPRIAPCGSGLEEERRFQAEINLAHALHQPTQRGTRTGRGRTMRRILVGLDGSLRAAGVLEAAVALAKAHGGKLTLVRAVGLPPDVPQDFWKATDEPLIDVLCKRARGYLEECLARVPAELRAQEAARGAVGVPWQAVCDTARGIQADLVVIGSHGYGGLDRLLGTTAAKIVNHANCTVLVVREPIRIEG